jgi:hypothetical protein
MKRAVAAKHERTFGESEPVCEKYRDKNSQSANNAIDPINREKSEGGEYRMPTYNNGINTKAEYNRRGSIVRLGRRTMGEPRLSIIEDRRGNVRIARKVRFG